MSFRLSFELSDRDLAHYRQLAHDARKRSEQRPEAELVESARALMDRVRDSHPPDFLRARLGDLDRLIAMLEDREWNLEGEDRALVVGALGYFADPLDLIPDSLPALGFLDDALMVELVVRDLRNELESYRDFCAYREKQEEQRGAQSPLEREKWLSLKRRQMILRMRQRRYEGRIGRLRSPAPLVLRYR